MTVATLSFAAAGDVLLRCAELGIDERRVLELSTPFVEWARAYAVALESRDREARLLALGRHIGRWLDGEQGWLARLLALAVPPLVVDVEVDARQTELASAVLGAPWELMASDDGGTLRHLTRDPTVRLGLARRIGPSGPPRPPQPGHLSVVFMAALPGGVAGLDVDRRDCEFLDAVDAIDQATTAFGLETAVEESGAVAGLAHAALRRYADVIHLSGTHQVEPPGLVFEFERDGEQPLVEVGVLARRPASGAARHVTARELRDQLGGYVPALCVLPTVVTVADGCASGSLAADLCRQGWPAVVCWAAPVEEAELRAIASRWYRHLTSRARLDVAIAEARAQGGAWHEVRLFLGPAGGDRLVVSSAAREVRVPYSPGFLDVGRSITVWKPGELYGYRPAVQATVAALREPTTRVVAIHGADGRLRASLAARTASAIDGLRRVVLRRRDQDGPEAILAQLARTVASTEVDRRVRSYLGESAAHRPSLTAIIRELLEGPCRDASAGAVLLIVHDLRLERPRARDGQVALPGTSATIASVIEAFHGAATASRLLITSSGRFVVYAAGGVVLAGAVRFAPFEGVAPAPLSRERARARALIPVVVGALAVGLVGLVVARLAGVDADAGAADAVPPVAVATVITGGLAAVARRPISPRVARTPGQSTWLAVVAIVVAALGLAGAIAALVGDRRHRTEAGVAPGPAHRHGAVAVDAGADAAVDAGADAAVDAGADAAVDARGPSCLECRQQCSSGNITDRRCASMCTCRP